MQAVHVYENHKNSLKEKQKKKKKKGVSCFGVSWKQYKSQQEYLCKKTATPGQKKRQNYLAARLPIESL